MLVRGSVARVSLKLILVAWRLGFWGAVGSVLPRGLVKGALTPDRGSLRSQSRSASLSACVLMGSQVSSHLPVAMTGSGP